MEIESGEEKGWKEGGRAKRRRGNEGSICWFLRGGGRLCI